MNNLFGVFKLFQSAVKNIAAESMVASAWKGLPPNDRLYGRTDLMFAIEHGYYDLAKSLLARDGALECDFEGKTPLMVAAEHGQIELLTMLLPHSDANAATYDGTTALMFAAAFGWTACVKALLAHSDAKASCKNGYTPLMRACSQDNEGCVDVLLPHSEIDATNCSGERAEDIAIKGQRKTVLTSLRRHAAHIERKALEEVSNPGVSCLKRRVSRI